jgi:hypothetical protein
MKNYDKQFPRIFFVLLKAILLFAFLPITILGQTPISYGDCLQESISSSAEIDVYTFSGNENDIVTIQASRSSGSLRPRIELYQGGNLLIGITGNPTARVDTLQLPNTGNYTILVLDGYNGTLTGGYGLCLQRTFNPLQGTSISYGTTHTDTLYFAAFMNAYTFTGETNDIITIQMARASGSLRPRIELYDPNGSLLKRITGNPTAIIDTLKLSDSGSYTILAVDGYNGTLTGHYGLWLQRTFNPEQADTIAYGETVAGTIGLAAQKNAYVFWGDVNDIITVQMSRTTGSLRPQIDLYNPAGTLLIRETGNPTARILMFTLLESGYYTIFAGDGYNGTLTGNYSLNLTKIPTAIEDQSVSGIIEKYELYQNYPNPFNPSTTISYQLPKLSQVKLTIYNMLGQEVRRLVHARMPAGRYDVAWDGRDEDGKIVSSGVYLYRLQAGRVVETRQMLLLR